MGFRTYASARAGVSAGGSVPAATASARGPGGWHPTVLAMLGLIVAEILVVGFLSRHLLG